MIDTYFKSYFWTFHLLILACAAFFVARTVNAYVGGALAPQPEAIVNAVASGSGQAMNAGNSSGAPLNAILDRNIFHAAREDIVAKAEEARAAEEKSKANFDPNRCDRSQMAAGLVSTVVAPDDPSCECPAKPECRSMAVFEDHGKKEDFAYRIGEKVLDEAELVCIEWRNVKVRHNGRCELFSLEEEDPTKATQAATPIASTPVETSGDAVDSEFGKNVKKISEKDYEIPRGEVEGVLSNLNKLATEARIMPNFENGKANGFKLVAIRPGSFYSKIGIQNGDVVQRINGHEMNSPDKALEIYSKLKDAAQITVDVSRNGKATTLSYSIR